MAQICDVFSALVFRFLLIMNWHNYLVYFHPSLVTLVGKKQKGREEKRRKEEEQIINPESMNLRIT